MHLKIKHGIFRQLVIPTMVISRLLSPLLAILLALQLTACGKSDEVDKLPKMVAVYKIHRELHLKSLVAPGRILGHDRFALAFPVEGTVKEIYVKAGQVLGSGALIARLDTKPYEIQLAKANQRYQEIKRALMKVNKEFSKGQITAKEFNQGKTMLRQAQSQVVRAKSDLAQTYLRTKEGGVIQKLFMAPKKRVAAGQTVITLLSHTEIHTKLSCNLLEKDTKAFVKHLKQSRSARIQLDETGEYQQIELTDLKIQRDAAKHQLFITVGFVGVDSKDLQPGQAIKFFVKDTRQQTFSNTEYIPPEAVSTDEKGKTWVWVINPVNQQVYRQPIIIGDLIDQKVEVIKGLTKGDSVVTYRSEKLKEGDRVEVVHMEK